MLRSIFPKRKPKKIFYRCYKNCDNEKSAEELKKHLSSLLDFESFHLAFKTLCTFKTKGCAKQQSKINPS